MIDWIKSDYIEIIGATLAFTYLILEVKQKWTMWIAGVISSIFYTYIFFHARLYAEMGMNAYFAIMSFYGLYCWKFSDNSKNELKITSIDIKKTGWLFGFSIIFFVIISWILKNYTDSPVPYADTLVSVLSIIATWMVAHKYIQHWYVWIFTNIFATGLYLYQNLYPTAMLFTVYSIMSVIGLVEWKKSMIIKNEKNEKN